MKQKKVLGLILSLVLVLCVAIPGTLASENLDQPALICEKTEHVHGDGCWTVPETPACGMEAGAGAHTHGDGCYGTVTSMSCTLPEDENHTHGDGCYVSQTVITCGLAESAGHVHDASCYPAVLSCTLEEHTHNAECYAAPLSDVEDAEPTCTCGSVDGTHIPGCPLYVAPTCTCGSVDGIHVEGCPLYVAPQEPTEGTTEPTDVEKKCTCIANEDGTLTYTEGCPVHTEKEDEEFVHIEGCSEECTDEECTCLCHLFERLMACETLDELMTLIAETPEEALMALSEEEVAEVDAKIRALEPQPMPPVEIKESTDEPVASEIVYTTENYAWAAPFGAPVEG